MQRCPSLCTVYDPGGCVTVNVCCCHSYQRGGEAEGHHEDVVQHHEELPAQVTNHSGSHQPNALARLLVTFDLQLVPVTQKHGVDVVGKVRRGK